MPPIGLAHLTLLRLSPPDLVTVAAAAGYDFVGVRVRAVTADERPWEMRPGSPLSRATRRRLDETGLVVRDVEFLQLRPETGPAEWTPMLDAGAALGASTLTVVGVDEDRSRLTDTLAALTADAALWGIRPTLEPISYQPVDTVREAAHLARDAGAAILVDALHVQRSGSPLTDVRELEPDLVPMLQICDGPLRPPGSGGRPAAEADRAALIVEARAQREVVGAGEFPLADLLSAAPVGTPVSVEVPHALDASITDIDLARRNLEGVRALLAG